MPTKTFPARGLLLMCLLVAVIAVGSVFAGCGGSSAKVPQIHFMVSTDGKMMSYSYTVTGEGSALAWLVTTFPDGYVLTEPLGVLDTSVSGDSTGSMPVSGTYTYKLYAEPAKPGDTRTTGDAAEKNVVASGSFVIP
jgi:hypothetical protein